MSLTVFFCLIGAAFAVPINPLSALPLVRAHNSVYGLESPHSFADAYTDFAGRFELEHPVHYVARLAHVGYETVDTPVTRGTEGVVPHVHIETAPLVESPVYIKSIPIYEKSSFGIEFGAGVHVPTVYKAFPRFVGTPVYGRTFGAEAFSPIVYKAFPTVLATRSPFFGDHSVAIPATADLYGKSFSTRFAVPSPLAAYPETAAPHHFKSIYPTESSSAYKTFPVETVSAYKTFPAESFAAYKTFPVHQDVAPVNAFYGRHVHHTRSTEVPAITSLLF